MANRSTPKDDATKGRDRSQGPADAIFDRLHKAGLSGGIAAGQELNVPVSCTVDAFAREYFMGYQISMRRLSRTDWVHRPTLLDWMLYAELCISLRIVRVHLEEQYVSVLKNLRVPDFFYVALAQMGVAKGLGYRVYPLYVPKHIDSSCIATAGSFLADEVKYVDLSTKPAISVGQETADVQLASEAKHPTVYARNETWIGFLSEMNAFLDSIAHKGYGVIEGCPPDVAGDFDTMLFMRADEAVNQTKSAIYHYSGQVDPGKALLSSFFNMRRVRENLNPVIPYSATMQGTGGFEEMLRALAMPG
jgi:hypothetical protein